LKTETNTEGLATYGYDAANQLTSVTRPAGQTNESYSYDFGGNRTMAGYTTGVGNELLASPGATYAYDAEGNLAAKTETSTGNTWAYSYDIRNRMTGVTEKNSGGSVIYQATYAYDALDRRIATTVNGTTTWTVYDGQNTYADFSGAGALKTRYLYGPAIDELLARTDSGGTTAWYLTDRLGSVRDLASTNGTALDHLAYDAYGNIVSESNPSDGDRFKWTAREWDGTMGLQFNRHRYYASSVGRWTQVDQLGETRSQSNLYSLVSCSPQNYTDPTGQTAEATYAPMGSGDQQDSVSVKMNPVTEELDAEVNVSRGTYIGSKNDREPHATNRNAPKFTVSEPTPNPFGKSLQENVEYLEQQYLVRNKYRDAKTRQALLKIADQQLELYEGAYIKNLELLEAKRAQLAKATDEKIYQYREEEIRLWAEMKDQYSLMWRAEKQLRPDYVRNWPKFPLRSDGNPRPNPPLPPIPPRIRR